MAERVGALERDAPVCDPMPAFLSGLVDLVDGVADGSNVLDTLSATIELASRGTGGIGASFVEFGPSGGRVVAATGCASAAVGRPATVDDPLFGAPLGSDRFDEVPLVPGSPGCAGSLAANGARTVARVRADAGPGTVVALQVYYAETGGLDQRARAAVTFVAVMLAHLYADRHALPLAAPTATGEPETPRWVARQQSQDLFVAVASHELRTPVTVIKGYADTLCQHWDALDDAARREAVWVLGQRSGELARLVDRLMSAASIAADGGDLISAAPFDLVDVLRTTVSEFPTDVRRRLRERLPDELPPVLGNRSSIATVFGELVTNATKYSDESSEVEVTADTEGSTVWFRVADRGVGVRPEQVERAFQRFWQGDSGDRRRYGGVGLGLYLVRRIVERQNGWVSLRPREMGGTVAEVRLPRADASSGEASGVHCGR